MDRGLLINPETLSSINDGDYSAILKKFDSQKPEEMPLVLTREIIDNIETPDILQSNWIEFEKTKVLYEKGYNKFNPERFFDYLVKPMPATPSACIIPEVELITTSTEVMQKTGPKEFVSYYKNRFQELLQILRSRQELANTLSISRLKGREAAETVTLIGMISEKVLTKNENFLITLEDNTGTVTMLVNKNKPDLYRTAKDLCLDEVIGISGVTGDSLLYVNEIFLPDIPLSKELKKSPEEEYAVFLGDPHFGSKAFLKKEFEKFITWITGSMGNSAQKEIASKVKYVFVAGDLVDGVGVYPNQEEDLDIRDIVGQYEEVARYLGRIPPGIKIIVSPGNHDAVRMTEPQPPLYPDFAAALYALPNVTMVPNPAMVNIGKKEGFSGFDVLIYHGTSFVYYGDAIESIRLSGGLERVDLIAQYLLKRRHLAPAHGSTLVATNYDKDPLIISKIPDFFVSGHIHRSTVSSYRNISILNCSCWIGQTKYQEKVGLKPQPARVPIVNLKTRETKMLSFLSETG